MGARRARLAAVLAAALALACHGASAGSPGGGTARSGAPDALVLVDGASADPAAWRVETPEPGARGAVALAPEAGARGGRCLELRWAFTGPHAREVAFRLPLAALDASRADHLAVHARGRATGGAVPELVVGFLQADPEVLLPRAGATPLRGVGPAWSAFRVPLPHLAGIRDWSRLDALVVTVRAAPGAGREGTFCLDDVTLLAAAPAGPTIHDPVDAPRKRAWKAAQGDAGGVARARAARLRGWPGRLRREPEALPRGDRAFLSRLARDTWRGLQAAADRDSGLPVDHVTLGKGSLAPERASVGDYVNTTTVGLHLMALAVAPELGLLPRAEAERRVGRLLDTLAGLERYRGFFFNYYDTTSLERTTNFVSSVDSAWLTAGLLVVRQAFPELHERCTTIVEDQDYGLFYDEAQQLLHHGVYVNLPLPSPYAYGVLYTEARLASLLAIGLGQVPEAHWFAMLRTFPASATWQRQVPRDRGPKTVRGHAFMGGHYAWRGLAYVPSWGGSLFEALMPTLVLDEAVVAPASLGANDRIHAEVQRRYAREVLGWSVWGLSPSEDPEGGYAESGVPELGSRGYAPRTVSPHAAALALAVLPEAATENLRRLAEQYDLYGDWGLYDAVDPRSGAVARAYLGLDQAMLFLALANHLEAGVLRRYFMADPVVRAALPVLAGEDFFD